MSFRDLPRTLVGDLGGRIGERVRVCGWAEELRGPGAPQMVALRDHTGSAPLVGSRGDGMSAVVDGLAPESAVEAAGTVQRAADGQVRVEVDELDVVGPAVDVVPLDETSTSEERLDWRHLDLRRPRNRLMFAAQTTAERAMRAYWHDHGFIELHSPKLRSLPNKSGAELFAVEYFDRPAYLVQSPQWYKQMAMAAGFDRVFEVGPAFRAEREVSSRHATEFTSVDVEIAWIRSDDELMAFEEEMLVRVLDSVDAEHGEELARHFGAQVRAPSVPFPRVTLDEAKKIVAATGWPAGNEDDDLDAEGERRLGEHVAREHGHEFVFVTDYPEPTRPFYHMRREGGSAATRSFDLLWKGLEITTGAQREHRHDQLVAQARSRGVPVEAIRQYLDFFRFGCPPHGGFGLGLTRLLMSMLGLSDMRQATYLFRGPDRLSP